MIQGKSVIAIVPARGGSKGLPGKNIKEICGKPLLAWSIEAGLQSKYVDHVMVSTDSEDIAVIARKFGAAIPFLRPPELASDTAQSIDVVRHAIEFYRDELSREFDLVVLLEPTSPLREVRDIDQSVEKLLLTPGATAIVGICKTEAQNPAFLIKKKNDFLIGYEDDHMPVIRRQDIADVYFFEGSIYVSDTSTLLAKNTFYHEATIGYEMPKWKSHEIDDIDDFIVVDALMRHKRSCS